MAGHIAESTLGATASGIPGLGIAHQPERGLDREVDFVFTVRRSTVAGRSEVPTAASIRSGTPWASDRLWRRRPNRAPSRAAHYPNRHPNRGCTACCQHAAFPHSCCLHNRGRARSNRSATVLSRQTLIKVDHGNRGPSGMAERVECVHGAPSIERLATPIRQDSQPFTAVSAWTVPWSDGLGNRFRVLSCHQWEQLTSVPPTERWCVGSRPWRSRQGS